ncbi:MAG: 3-keto-disaccharide hydrolase [Ginsengibacter sp.]
MKKYFWFLLIVTFALLTAYSADAQKNNEQVLSTIDVFPYQHSAETDRALTAMETWKKQDWKTVMKLLDDDSLKVKATYAINAYVNGVAPDASKRNPLITLLKKYSSSVKTEYARIFIQSQLKLLTDSFAVHAANASLPPLPQDKPAVASASNNVQQLLALEDEMDKADNPLQKQDILWKASRIPGFSSFMLVSKSLKDPDVSSQAALIITRLALADDHIKGPVVRQSLETALPLIKGEDSAILASRLQKHLLKMPYDYGFVSLFNGVDLTGWKALVGNPVSRAKMSASALQAAQDSANEKTKGDWIAKEGLLIFTGHGNNLATTKKYGDIEMYVDWKITAKGDAGIYLRGTPQVQIWDTSRRNVGAQVGSGGLYNNQKYESKPLTVADNKIGDWNRFHILMKGDRVTVYLNGVLVTDHVPLENYWDRSLPLFPSEQLELQAHGTEVAYRNIYVRELPANTRDTLTPEEKKQGFVSLFDGTDLDQWTGNKSGYIVKDGVIEVNPQDGSVGNLYTKDEFSNFMFRFEFQLTPGANNGIGIRAPLEGDAAYAGMEIQILDNEAPKYKDLHVYQYHGSVYGVIPAKRGFLLPAGEWNKEEIIANGNKIKVILNGTVILDGDIKEASKNGTMDHKEHPGLLRKTGHIGFLGHGDVVRFRNVRVKKL